MPIFGKDEIEEAAHLIYKYMPPTPQYVWPLLCRRVGATVWAKHENHTPTGAFKIRGGITFINWLRQNNPKVAGIITATRGNHGQSQARAATRSVSLKGEYLYVDPRGCNLRGSILRAGLNWRFSFRNLSK